MRNLLAAVLFSTATLACTKTPDPNATVAADPTAAPSPAGTPAAAPAPAPSAPSAPAAAAPAPAPSAAAVADDTTPPDLVEAAPGVQVVADYDTPVFFNSGVYWRHNTDGWYSSSAYTGGWEYKATPPSAIVSIDHPEHFEHYRPSGYVAHRKPAPQREWHPEPVHAEAHVDPHADVHADVHAEPHAEVRVEPHPEVHPAPVVVKPVPKPVVREHRD